MAAKPAEDEAVDIYQKLVMQILFSLQNIELYQFEHRRSPQSDSPTARSTRRRSSRRWQRRGDPRRQTNPVRTHSPR
ncbi:hypothetical protein OAS39_10305 [Pirellulales bacterium]|nr:hypothetical protein [Pirellulales bacterium]